MTGIGQKRDARGDLAGLVRAGAGGGLEGDEGDGDRARERVRLGIGGLWPWAGPVEREGLP